jgi:tripartite-type tricarboxylate transporter receptor subunit TctC
MVMLPALTRLPFDTTRDLVPITIMGANPQVLAVSTRINTPDLASFLAYLRAQQGRAAYSSGGNGASNHLAMALLLQRAGLEATHVPYRDGAPAVAGLLAGDVVAYFGNPSDVIGHHGGPAIRVIAVAGLERMPALPAVPSVAEQSFPGFRANLERLGTLPVCSSPPQMAAAIASDGPLWAELVRNARISID